MQTAHANTHLDLYIDRCDEIGSIYADTVGRYQDGFLADGVTSDLDAAFCRAVDTAERLLPVLRIKAGIAACPPPPESPHRREICPSFKSSSNGPATAGAPRS